MAHVGTQTDFRCVCMLLTAGMGSGAAGLPAMGGSLLQAAQPTAGVAAQVAGCHYPYDMALTAQRMAAPGGGPGGPMAGPTAFAAATATAQATNGPPHGSYGFWGRPMREYSFEGCSGEDRIGCDSFVLAFCSPAMAMHPHPHQVANQPAQFHPTHPHAAFPHPGAHPQVAFSQVATHPHPHQLGGALRYPDTGGGRFGYRVGHFSPATPCRYGAIGSGRPGQPRSFNGNGNGGLPTAFSLLRPVSGGAQVTELPSTSQANQQRLDELELELEMQLELDLEHQSDGDNNSTDVSNSGAGGSAAAAKNRHNGAANGLSAGSVAGDGGDSADGGGREGVDGEGAQIDDSSSVQSSVHRSYRSRVANVDQDTTETSGGSGDEEEDDDDDDNDDEEESESESETESDDDDDDDDEEDEEEEETEPNTVDVDSEDCEGEPRPNRAASMPFVQDAALVNQEPPPRRFCFGQVQFLGYTLPENPIQTGPSPRLPQSFGAAYLEHGAPQTPREHLPCAQVVPHILPGSFVGLPTVIEEIQLGGPLAAIPGMAAVNLGVVTSAVSSSGGSIDNLATSSSASSSDPPALFSGPSTSQHIQRPGPDFNPPPLLADASSIFIRSAVGPPPPPPPPPPQQMFPLMQERPLAPILFEVGGNRSATGAAHVVIQNVNGNLGLVNAAAAAGGHPSASRGHLGVAFNAGGPLGAQSLLPPHMRGAAVNMNPLNVNMNHVGHVNHLNHMGRGLGMGVGMGMAGPHLVPMAMPMIAPTRLQQPGLPQNPPTAARCYTPGLNPSPAQNLNLNLGQNLGQVLNLNLNQVLNHNLNQALHQALAPVQMSAPSQNLNPSLNLNHSMPGGVDVANGSATRPLEAHLGEGLSIAAHGPAPPLSTPASLVAQAAQAVQVVQAAQGVQVQAAPSDPANPKPDQGDGGSDPQKPTQPSYASVLQ